MRRLNYLTVFILLVNLACGGTQFSKEHPEKAQEIQDLIDTKEFTITFERAFPRQSHAFNQVVQGLNLNAMGSSGASINLIGNTNYLKFEQDTIKARLPFFGERHMGYTPSGHGSIKFDGVPKEYSEESIKNYRQIKFHISDKNNSTEHYDVALKIFENGTANLSLISTQRATISYKGAIKRKESK